MALNCFYCCSVPCDISKFVFIISHLNSVALLQSRPTVSVIFLRFFLCCNWKEIFLPHIWVATVHLVLVPIHQPKSVISVKNLSYQILLLGPVWCICICLNTFGFSCAFSAQTHKLNDVFHGFHMLPSEKQSIY